jgi:hypothetical protein
MPSSTNITLDCTVTGHIIETVSETIQRVRGLIQTPVDCEYPVYYSATLTRTGNDTISIDGIAGFDSQYEKKRWHWDVNIAENTVYIADFSRFNAVDCLVFHEYDTNVFYKKNNILYPSRYQDRAFPYYQYPRTCDGPILPQLVDYVLQPNKYKIVFVL